MCSPPSRSMLGLLTAVQAVTLSSPPPGLSGYSTRFDAGGALASIRRSSAAAVAAALSDGKELLEIEFPPLIESKGQFDDFSNVEVLDANRDFGVQLALEPEIQAPAAPPSTHTPLPLASSSPRGPYHAAARISAGRSGRRPCHHCGQSRSVLPQMHLCTSAGGGVQGGAVALLRGRGRGAARARGLAGRHAARRPRHTPEPLSEPSRNPPVGAMYGEASTIDTSSRRRCPQPPPHRQRRSIGDHHVHRGGGARGRGGAAHTPVKDSRISSNLALALSRALPTRSRSCRWEAARWAPRLLSARCSAAARLHRRPRRPRRRPRCSW